MRLAGTQEDVRYGWTGGIIEDAEPPQGYRKIGFSWVPLGVMDSCVNFVRTTDGRMAVRNGSQQKLALVDASGNPMTSVRSMQRYSQEGAVIVAHDSVHLKHYAYYFSGDLVTQEARTDLAWNSATPAAPRAVELFEEVYIADATRAFANRQQMVALDAAGNPYPVTADFGSGAEAVRPFCHAVYNDVLFISGQDAGQKSAPAMVRHSFLGTSPRLTGGFDPEAYATIGAAGEYITAMVPGRNILLLAKEDELYRLSGFGRALEGWQYAVQPITNTDYVGVKWPGALCFAEGYWYGLAEAGPFRTDGMQIELLVRPRLRSWRDVTGLDQAVVRYDPTRRAILFGLLYTGDTAIRTVWLWDIDQEQWMADWTLPVGVVDIYALATQGLAGPDAAPQQPTLNPASSTFSAIAGSFTAGDATASTNVWIDKGAGFVKDQTLGPGVTTFTISGLTASTKFPVKLEHIKNGISSGYSPIGYGYTLLQAPTLSAASSGANAIGLTVGQQAGGADLVLQRTTGGPTTLKTWPAQAVGTVTYSDAGLTAQTTYAYAAYATRSDWPASINQSASATASATTGASNLPVPSAPTFDPTLSTLTSVHGSFTPGDASLETDVYADTYGSGFTWVTTLAAGVTTFTVDQISGVRDSMKVPVELRHKDPATGNTSNFSPVGYGYTKLAAPTLAKAASTTSSITVKVTTDNSCTVSLTRPGYTLYNGPQTSGDSLYYDTGLPPGTSETYSCYVTRSDWPSQINTSPTVTATYATNHL